MGEEEDKIRLSAIAAMDEARVIGYKNELPWHLPEDLKRFSALTRGHSVLMGRKTYESLPTRYRPLPARKNIVLSRRPPEELKLPPEVTVFSSPDAFIEAVAEKSLSLPSRIVWVIGGEKIYRATMKYLDEIYLTIVTGKHEGDAFFPAFEENFVVVEEEKADSCTFLRYKRKD